MIRYNLIGEKFTRLQVIEKIGSNKYGQVIWKCICDCGNKTDVITSKLRNGNTKSCGCLKLEKLKQQNGENSRSWRGGKYEDKCGYIRIWNYKNEKSKYKYEAEHRIIMEEFLGRKLLPNENIHHKNGIKNDNRLENLELWVVSQPYGQRVEDLVKWAEEILQKYKPERLNNERA